MEGIYELKKRLEEERPQNWEALPDISLYMEQLISYISRQLIHYGDEEVLTPAMVNNYIKDGVMPRAEGKRYSRTHLTYLTAICALKQVLPVKDVGYLLQTWTGEREPEDIYTSFCQVMDEALSESAGLLDGEMAVQNLPQLALTLALDSYARRLACRRILDLMAEPIPQKQRLEKGVHYEKAAANDETVKKYLSAQDSPAKENSTYPPLDDGTKRFSKEAFLRADVMLDEMLNGQ